MCRWLAYSGSPVRLEDVVYKPDHSLIDQSLRARMGVETTNGDGFGMGWYTEDRHVPSIYRDIGPAWSNRNLRELAAAVSSGLFCAHIRASTGTPVQQTNCHPFRYRQWLWMHNGLINGYASVRRDLLLAVDPELFSGIEGTTDSELMFFLALSLGLEEDPPGAVERMVGLVERTARCHRIEYPVQMTIALSNGECLWAFRYSTERQSRSLFHSLDVQCLRDLHPDHELIQQASADARLVVSEPLGDLLEAWQEVPESSYTVVRRGGNEIRTFTPQSA
ncbi:class II glutamine amidotransferase [Streptantibioticus ferralitis]|uniref:Class II glutamine amidotransferase n=1 Tax=Streptantibioticus ferralitis TaxID=236510 RepID=A0ABT5YVP2_9ACTN|nr:class II glutamine amidotransferase [Streptantibioticus ferralitis]MDF2255543.1 class II glutamine amidotransferase [Streptantibioticus ferralitis]